MAENSIPDKRKFNLHSFRKMTSGFTRGCNFEIGVLGTSPTSESMTRFMSSFATSTGLPSKNITQQVINLQYGHFPINVAGSVTFTPWTVTFLGDDMMLLRNMFVAWQEMIHNTRDSTFTPSIDYKVDNFWAAVLNTRDIPVQVYHFYGLWPSDVQGLTVSQSDTAVLQFSVTFSYDSFVTDDTHTWRTVESRTVSGKYGGFARSNSEEEKRIVKNYASIQ